MNLLPARPVGRSSDRGHHRHAVRAHEQQRHGHPIPRWGRGWSAPLPRYRIDWLADRVVFSIDGTVRHTQNVVITGGMGTVVSDYAAGGASVTINQVRMAAATRTGIFTSRVLNAGTAATGRPSTWQRRRLAAPR